MEIKINDLKKAAKELNETFGFSIDVKLGKEELSEAVAQIWALTGADVPKDDRVGIEEIEDLSEKTQEVLTALKPESVEDTEDQDENEEEEEEKPVKKGKAGKKAKKEVVEEPEKEDEPEDEDDEEDDEPEEEKPAKKGKKSAKELAAEAKELTKQKEAERKARVSEKSGKKEKSTDKPAKKGNPNVGKKSEFRQSELFQKSIKAKKGNTDAITKYWTKKFGTSSDKGINVAAQILEKNQEWNIDEIYAVIAKLSKSVK